MLSKFVLLPTNFIIAIIVIVRYRIASFNNSIKAYRYIYRLTRANILRVYILTLVFFFFFKDNNANSLVI